MRSTIRAADPRPAMTPDRFRLSRLAALALLSAGALPAFAQTWPTRPLHIIVPYPSGGISDLVARAIGDRLAAQMGQPVVVENKAGSGGNLGGDAVA